MSELVLEKHDELPKNWIKAKLNDLCELIGGGTPSRNNSEYFGGNIIWLTPTEIPKNTITRINDSREKITDLGLKKSSARIIPKESVLLTSRASIGYVAIAGDNVTTNQGFASFICYKPLFNYYLAYWLWGNKKNIESEATGTTFKEITKSKLREMIIPLPSLNEQKRIVTKIEELFSLIESTKQLLEKTAILIKQSKRSFLKSAFEGNLTSKWREENKILGISISDILEKNNSTSVNLESKCEELYSIPESWSWVRVNQICSKINDGTHFSPSNSIHGDIPYVTAKNIRPNKIDLTNVTYISKKIHDDIYSRCNPEKGDILYTKDGTVGYSVVNPFDFEFSLLSSVALLKPLKNIIDSYFLSHYLNSPVNFYRITGKMTGTALRRVILERIKEIPIPLAPLIEQKIIVSKIDEGLSIIEQNENLVNLLLLQINYIKNSILKQAFEGKLVPQDPNDEPAKILLEKIKQEKQKIISQTKREKKNDK